MAVFDSSTSGDLLRQFEAANEAEGVAIREVLTAQKQGSDRATIMELAKRMAEIHNKKMGIWNQLQEARIDK